MYSQHSKKVERESTGEGRGEGGVARVGLLSTTEDNRMG